MEQISAHKCFEGRQLRFRHASRELDCLMHFSVYLPPAAGTRNVPAIYWLSGLTCTDENFVQKSGAQQYAARHNVALVVPDTSPRGEGVPDDPDGHWDFGLGAGFYVDATQSPWSRHYRMYSYITRELPGLVEGHLPVAASKSIMGHSMGGHGALTVALKNPGRYACVSAFAPICNPAASPWGIKAFTHLLGEDRETWNEYDTCALVAQGRSRMPLLIEQGGADSFLQEQLMPENLQAVCEQQGYPLTYNCHDGYDHSYFFIATFIEQHVAYHARRLESL